MLTDSSRFPRTYISQIPVLKTGRILPQGRLLTIETRKKPGSRAARPDGRIHLGHSGHSPSPWVTPWPRLRTPQVPRTDWTQMGATTRARRSGATIGRIASSILAHSGARSHARSGFENPQHLVATALKLIVHLHDFRFPAVSFESRPDSAQVG